MQLTAVCDLLTSQWICKPTLITDVLQVLYFLSDNAHDASKSTAVQTDEMALLPFPPHNFASSKLLLRTVNNWGGGSVDTACTKYPHFKLFLKLEIRSAHTDLPDASQTDASVFKERKSAATLRLA